MSFPGPCELPTLTTTRPAFIVAPGTNTTGRLCAAYSVFIAGGKRLLEPGCREAGKILSSVRRLVSNCCSSANLHTGFLFGTWPTCYRSDRPRLSLARVGRDCFGATCLSRQACPGGACWNQGCITRSQWRPCWSYRKCRCTELGRSSQADLRNGMSSTTPLPSHLRPAESGCALLHAQREA
jgi:hypothetical protein